MKSRRKRRTEVDADVEISMTPMIDVVFQLLIYFLVTFSTADLVANLNVSRADETSKTSASTSSGDRIRVAVECDQFLMNNRVVSAEELRSMLGRLAAVSLDQQVLVSCDDQALHGRMVEVLDMCAEFGLTKISILSQS